MTRTTRKLILLLLATAAALVASACRPGGDGAAGSNAGGSAAATSGLTVTVEVEGGAVGPAPVTVGVRTGSEPVSGATVQVTGNMTHAGMVPVIVDAVEVEPGVYRADTFAFTMAGDWFIDADVSTADGREASAETFLTVGR